MQERIIHGDSFIDGDLVIEGFNYIVKGDLVVEDTVIIKDGDLIVEGNLLVRSNHNSSISVSCGSIYAKSITVYTNINILNGNISTLKDLDCWNICCYEGDISVGGNSDVLYVFCRNYLVDGENRSIDIEAEKSVYIMKHSSNHCIVSPEVFLGEGGDFNGNFIITNHFEFNEHIYNCLGRLPFCIYKNSSE